MMLLRAVLEPSIETSLCDRGSRGCVGNSCGSGNGSTFAVNLGLGTIPGDVTWRELV